MKPAGNVLHFHLTGLLVSQWGVSSVCQAKCQRESMHERVCAHVPTLPVLTAPLGQQGHHGAQGRCQIRTTSHTADTISWVSLDGIPLILTQPKPQRHHGKETMARGLDLFARLWYDEPSTWDHCRFRACTPRSLHSHLLERLPQ